MPALHFDAEFYVLVGFALFLGVLLWTGAHSKFTALIDSRIDRIKNELAEAERLRTEAETLLASFEKKREEAEAESPEEKMPTDKLVDVSPLALRMSSPFNAGYWLAAA